MLHNGLHMNLIYLVLLTGKIIGPLGTLYYRFFFIFPAAKWRKD